MNISVVGAGFVGLVTAACFAEQGHSAVCVDLDAAKVAAIRAGECPIHEAGLPELLRRHIGKRLRASSDLKDAIHSSDVTFLCVGTPSGEAGIELHFIEQACRDIGVILRGKPGFHVVVVKSTVVPGTTEGIVTEVLEKASGKKAGMDFGVAMNPEFLREGAAVEDFMHPDRIVLGTSDTRSLEILEQAYAAFSGVPVVQTSPRTAEMVKYATNSLLAILISYANEVANICSSFEGLDAAQVWRGVHLDRRFTAPEAGMAAGLAEYVWHGLGFGGSCLPKDVHAIRKLAQTRGVPTPVLDAALMTNQKQPGRIVELLEPEIALSGARVAVLGLAFKPGTDDLRESPALRVVGDLVKRGARVVAHDPVAMENARKHPGFHGVEFAPNWQAALRGSDACCLITRWPEYQEIQPEEFARLMRNPLVVDGRGIYHPQTFANKGVHWKGIGFKPGTAPEIKRKAISG